MGLWALAWFVGISVVVLWVSTCGCAVVHGYQRGSICLISVKLCYGLIFDLVRLFFLFFFAVVGGCRLRSGRGSLLGDGFFFSLLLWFVVVVGGGDGGGG